MVAVSQKIGGVTGIMIALTDLTRKIAIVFLRLGLIIPLIIRTIREVCE